MSCELSSLHWMKGHFWSQSQFDEKICHTKLMKHLLYHCTIRVSIVILSLLYASRVVTPWMQKLIWWSAALRIQRYPRFMNNNLFRNVQTVLVFSWSYLCLILHDFPQAFTPVVYTLCSFSLEFVLRLFQVLSRTTWLSTLTTPPIPSTWLRTAPSSTTPLPPTSATPTTLSLESSRLRILEPMSSSSNAWLEITPTKSFGWWPTECL